MSAAIPDDNTEQPLGTVLVVDDDPNIREFLTDVLEVHGYRVRLAVDGEDAWDRLGSEAIDLVLADVDMPRMTGIELLDKMKGTAMLTPVAMITGAGTTVHAVAALKLGAFEFLQKPCSVEELVALCRKGMSLKQNLDDSLRIRDLTSLQTSVRIPSDTSYISAVIGHVTRMAEEVGYARSRYGVHIWLGLQEALANAICHGNRRDKKKFVTIAVSATAEKLVMQIRDEGCGFDIHDVPDPRSPENLLMQSGRGILLLQCYMDEVRFNETGNQITLIKFHADYAARNPDGFA